MKLPYVALGDIACVTWGNTSITKSSYVPNGAIAFSATGPDGFLAIAEHDEKGIVLSAIGARCGRCFFATGKWTAIKNTITITSNQCDPVDMRYLWFYLNREGIWPSRGGGQPFIGLGTARAVEVPLPPLSEQKRIAGILDQADGLRRKRQQALALTDQFLRSTFLDLFGDPVTNPKRWPVVPLASLVADDDSINYGVVQPGDEVADGIPIVRVGDFRDMAINTSNLKRIAPSIEAQYKRSRLQGDEILIACVGSIGAVAIADERLKGMNIARAVARVRCGSQANRLYLASLFVTTFIQSYFTNETRTVAQPTLNIKQIAETPIMLPAKGLQD